MTIVGMPLSCNAGMIGSVPPARLRIGLIPNAVSNASWAILTSCELGSTRPGAGRAVRLEFDRRTLGRGLVQQALDRSADRSGSWPGASRTVKFACACAGIGRVLQAGLAADDSVRRRRSGSAVVRR